MLKVSASDIGHFTHTSEKLIGDNIAPTSCRNKITAATLVTLIVSVIYPA